ncbi:MAG TPA: peptidase M28, partial [Blastocatellia bacterium]|nr:peptidase M28 [Blastocatellia bacterium]
MRRIAFITCSVFLMVALATAQTRQTASGAGANPPASAMKTITADRLMTHINKLASDEFEGRSPATRGEELTIKYLADEFKAAGLAPGNTDGTYYQKVPLVGITTKVSGDSMSVKAGDKDMTLKYGDDFVART